MKFSIKKVDLLSVLSGSTKASKLTGDSLVIAEFAPKKKNDVNGLSDLFSSVNKRINGAVADYVIEEEFDFKLGSVMSLRLNSAEKYALDITDVKKIFIVGLGEKKDFNKKSERKALASLIRKANSEKVEKLIFSPIQNVDLLVETAILVNYEFKKYKTEKKTSDDKKLNEIVILKDSVTAKDKQLIEKAELIANGTCLARDLVWEPACVVTPSYLATQAKKIKGDNLTVNVLEKSACEQLKMGAYLAVAQGSDQPPKFIEFTYKPKGKVKKHIALVGKGVTFDSGGLSLKPAKAMEMMKEDMSGAASVFGIMSAISKLQPSNVQITAIVAACENMPSGKAYRPGDVITAMNGKTIEVNNTDAEGRLTLADAVTYVSGKNPDVIIDIATLTGACMVALGNVCAGLMTNHQELLDEVKSIADEQGENMWQLPLFDEYKAKLKSPIADLINAGSGGQAGAQNGGLFIQEFIGNKGKTDKQIPWLHIDIAGPCWLDSESDWSPKGASGIPVRTLLNYILNI